MKLYNTLTRKIDQIEPIDPPKLGFYSCGPTVYDYTHIGHLRRYTMDDFLIRTLRHAGFKVKFVQNVTDVGHLASDADTGEDKMEKGAKKYKATVWDVAKKFEDHFYNSLEKLNNLRPDNVCRVTEYIDEQIEMIKDLEQKGYTYVIDDDGVYFDTSKLDDYGKLARLDIKSLREGARVEKVVGRRNPTDFALWKFEREGENRAMVWPSPWSERGFPGWHIECSTISKDQLGDQVDIHSGGIDHIPVHHTNEIAQSETVSGKKPFVKYWVHHNFLQINGQKMSKSLGNLFTIEDIIERGFHPLALRLLFLTAHYRSEMNFTWENLAGSQKSYQKLINLVLDLQQGEAGIVDEDQVKKYEQQFFGLMEDDLKTSEALAVLWEVTKAELSKATRLKILLDFDQVLGLGLAEVKAGDLPPAVEDLLTKRQQARDEQDFTQADELRQQLKSLGYSVKDTPQGQKINKLD